MLGTQLAGAQLKTDARPHGKDVDLIIGTAFRPWPRKKDADQALAALTRPGAGALRPPC